MNVRTIMLFQRLRQLRLRASYLWGRTKIVTKQILWETDTTTIRGVLALASVLFAAILEINVFFGHPAMDRPAYDIMQTLGADHFWATAFFLHFLGVSWRFIDEKARPKWAFLINFFGFALWTFSTASMNYSLHLISPATSMEAVICLASVWVLFRTDLRREALTP